MPTYDYRCSNCEATFTARKKIQERRQPEEVECTECGEKTVELAIGGVNTVSGVEIVDKRPDGWKEVLTRAHQYAGRNSKMDF